MSDDDEPRNQGQNDHIGQALESMSVDELDKYKARLEQEIARVEAERKRKADVRLAAEKLFSSNR